MTMYNTFSQWVLVFTLFSVLGWALESLFQSVRSGRPVNKGFLIGPWSPVYGFITVSLLLITRPFMDYPPAVLVLAALFFAFSEYTVGWLMELIFKIRWWDYSSRRFNLRGRICLANTLTYALLGVFSVYVLYPLASHAIGFIPAAAERVLASAILVAFFFDTVLFLYAAARFEERLSSLHRHFVNPSGMRGTDDTRKRSAAAVRLLRAFPGLKHKYLTAELDALKGEWTARLSEGRTAARERLKSLRGRTGLELRTAKLSYKGITPTRMVWVFLIGCVIGYVVETLFCLVTKGTIESRQGMIYGPFSQIYGFGAVVLVLLLTPLAALGDGWLFAGGAVAGGLFEAGCSLLQEAMLGSVSWEYSHQSFSFFGGRTSLLYMFFWGILAVMYMKHIYPRIISLISLIPGRPKHTFTWIITVVLAADLMLSGTAVNRWEERQRDIPPKNSADRWLDKRYPDDMLREIYPNMTFTQTDGIK